MRVILVVLDGVEILDLAGPAQVFDQARTAGAELVLVFAGLTASVASAQGLGLAALRELPRSGAGDLVLVPGFELASFDAMAASQRTELLRYLRAAVERGARVGSVCAGAFALGAAGLLDGRACTTHWKMLDELRRRHRHARVVDDRLFVEDGPIVTSAGIASGVDLALSLVEEHFGARLCAEVARRLVVSMRRDGSARQRSVFLQFRDHLHPGVHRVQDRLAQDLAARHTLESLARVARLSSRHLTRTFREATGISLKDYQTRMRIERCRELLAGTSMTADEIAAHLGFGDARQLRRIWKNVTGTTLQAERAVKS